jgi:hypothetical protein
VRLPGARPRRPPLLSSQPGDGQRARRLQVPPLESLSQVPPLGSGPGPSTPSLSLQCVGRHGASASASLDECPGPGQDSHGGPPPSLRLGACQSRRRLAVAR